MDITHITSLLGGIALFLYGMSIMGAGLEKLAGGKMQGVLQKLTSSTLKAVIFGTLITGVIQSSAGTVVICVGLVNSGIMTLTQSVGVIMGANIGTTVTGQLIRMADISGDSLWLTLIQPKTFAPVVAFIGCIFYVFLRNAKKKNIGQIMLGFGILFTGMSLMDTGVAPLRESAVFQNLFVTMTNPILGVLVGAVIAFSSLSGKTDLYLTCIAVNLAATGGTVFVMYLLTGEKATTSAAIKAYTLPTVVLPLINKIPLIGPMLSGHNVLTYLAFISIFAVWFFLTRTRLGLRLRAVGENARAAASVGINVKRIGYVSFLISGVLCGFGGAFMSMGWVSFFMKNMVNGRGYIGLSACNIAGGDPLGAGIAAVFFKSEAKRS